MLQEFSVITQNGGLKKTPGEQALFTLLFTNEAWFDHSKVLINRQLAKMFYPKPRVKALGSNTK